MRTNERGQCNPRSAHGAGRARVTAGSVMARRLVALGFCALALGGCATVPAEECATADWYALGVKDGRDGYPPERIAQHREACAGVKVEPDELRYLQGRKAGLAEYCQPDNAFRDGLAGREYRGACDAAFARNHAAAYRVASLQRAIERNRGDVMWREAEIRGDKASDARRAQLRSDVYELDRKRVALRNDLVAAERDLDRLRALQAAAPAVPSAPAAASPSPVQSATSAAAPVVSVGKPGTATGKLVVNGSELPLRFAYAFVAPDPLDALQPRPMLLLTGQAIPEASLAAAPDLDRVLGALPAYVLVVRNEATPPSVALLVWHSGLGAVPAMERDAGKAGAAKFDAYGAQRIAGRVASPQNGKRAFAWNRAIRLDVRFDAPLVRRWP
jgi:hypothetical protein